MVVEKKPSSKSGLCEELVFGIQLQKYKNRNNVQPSKSQTKFQVCHFKDVAITYIQSIDPLCMIFRGFYVFFSVREHHSVLATNIHTGMRASKSQLAIHKKLPACVRKGGDVQ